MRHGRIEIKSERVDLATIIERAIETMQSPFDARDQVMIFLRPPVRAWVHGDPVRLEQVFTNLLANASKFSGPYTRAEIKVELAGNTVLARVRDQGSGIDAQLLPRVFEPFTQGDQSLDRPTAGLGIGLALVKSVVALHGGSVEARSDGLGLGSEFVVSLPMSEAAEELQDSPKTEHGHVRRRVLIIEDNADSAESLRILLRLAGHEVVSTNQAFTALEVLESFVPEWILSDIGLPGLDGYSLATMIRNHPNGRTAQLYAVTGYGRAQDRELALQSGFDGHLTKPVDPKVLLGLLDADVVKNDATSNESNAEH